MLAAAPPEGGPALPDAPGGKLAAGAAAAAWRTPVPGACAPDGPLPAGPSRSEISRACPAALVPPKEPRSAPSATVPDNAV